jgi:polyphosphate kinase
MLKYIEQEAENAAAGKPARIIAKMNSLIEPEIIRALYKASRAGVKIDLIVRGMCAVRPGVAGVSENIRVVSIVGRFLEHSRIFYFENGGDPVVYCASADWMQRNLFQRVETCFPILDERLRARVVTQGLLYYLEDNVQSWELQANGEYRRLCPEHGKPALSVQNRLLLELAEKASVHAKDAPLPRRLRKKGKQGKGAR